MDTQRTIYSDSSTSVQPVSQTLQIPTLQPLQMPAAVIGQTGGKILQVNTVLLNMEVAKEPYVVTYTSTGTIDGAPILGNLSPLFYFRIKKIRLDGDKNDINSLSVRVKTQDINKNISIDRTFPIVNYTRYIDQLGNAQEMFTDIIVSSGDFPGIRTQVTWQKASPLNANLTITVEFDIIPYK